MPRAGPKHPGLQPWGRGISDAFPALKGIQVKKSLTYRELENSTGQVMGLRL